MPRVLINEDPMIANRDFTFARSPWPAKWIGPADVPGNGGVWAFRRAIELPAPQTLRIHVSADQRYILKIDGMTHGRGPERSDPRHWMYDTYDVALSAGVHVFVAIVWWMNPTGAAPPPWSQMTVRPGFWLMGEATASALDTGDAWEAKSIEGIAFDQANQIVDFSPCVGPHVRVDAARYPQCIDEGKGAGWAPANVLQASAVASLCRDAPATWLLRPAMLLAMIDRPIKSLQLRHLDAPPSHDTVRYPVLAERHLIHEANHWQAAIDGKSLAIAPGQRRRAIIDLGIYACAYTTIHVTGGRGAMIRARWAESLRKFDASIHATPRDAKDKANRDQIEGRICYGYADTFLPDGNANRSIETLWWNAGRYIELFIEAGDEPLQINSFVLRETGYPYAFESTFQSDDDRLEKISARSLHTLRMCSHETSMDCPYYEQLNYAGDTRLQSLVAMTQSRDDRLVRKSIQLFDWSRTGDGWTASRYPSSIGQTIPPFALAWVGMVHDYAMWRGDRDFVRSVMPGVRSVMERWRQQIDARGLVILPAGWNFIDWATGWTAGMSNPHAGTPCGIVQWQIIYTLIKLAELEDWMNEPLLAQRDRQTAVALAATAERFFFDRERKCFADDLAHIRFSEHAQAMALLSGQLSHNLQGHVIQALAHHPSLTRATAYFSHYLFEAVATVGRMDLFFNRLGFWFDHESLGLSTILEKPEPARSDCHAWGAHPAYQFLATILGIRPGSFGFATANIRPQLGPLKWAKGTMIHPAGTIEASFEMRGGTLHGRVSLPAGVDGIIHLPDRDLSLRGGTAAEF